MFFPSLRAPSGVDCRTSTVTVVVIVGSVGSLLTHSGTSGAGVGAEVASGAGVGTLEVPWHGCQNSRGLRCWCWDSRLLRSWCRDTRRNRNFIGLDLDDLERNGASPVPFRASSESPALSQTSPGSHALLPDRFRSLGSRPGRLPLPQKSVTLCWAPTEPVRFHQLSSGILQITLHPFRYLSGSVREGEYDEHDEGHDEAAANLVDDNWGGSQYEPEVAEEEPSTEDTDLGNLIDFSTEARMGSMQFRYCAMRIDPSSDEERIAAAIPLGPLDSMDYDDDPLERQVADLYGASALEDVWRLSRGREYRSEEPLDVAEATQLRRDLLAEHEYPSSERTVFPELLYEHGVRYGDDSLLDIAQRELPLIMALGSAEHEREAGQYAVIRPTGDHMSVSTQTLERNEDYLLEQAASFARNIEQTRIARAAVRDVISRVHEAMVEVPSEDDTGGHA
ncbi:hypothetical protein B0H11DRAFT_2257722 [Mycena galericulata]|nr:hypothetical protein B0H11DRAFT_2257722 [Mycena galericulata]